jgi:hypothetical protein
VKATIGPNGRVNKMEVFRQFVQKHGFALKPKAIVVILQEEYGTTMSRRMVSSYKTTLRRKMGVPKTERLTAVEPKFGLRDVATRSSVPTGHHYAIIVYPVMEHLVALERAVWEKKIEQLVKEGADFTAFEVKSLADIRMKVVVL